MPTYFVLEDTAAARSLLRDTCAEATPDALHNAFHHNHRSIRGVDVGGGRGGVGGVGAHLHAAAARVPLGTSHRNLSSYLCGPRALSEAPFSDRRLLSQGAEATRPLSALPPRRRAGEPTLGLPASGTKAPVQSGADRTAGNAGITSGNTTSNRTRLGSLSRRGPKRFQSVGLVAPGCSGEQGTASFLSLSAWITACLWS